MELEKPSGTMSSRDLRALIDQCRSWQAMEAFISQQGRAPGMFEDAARAISDAMRLRDQIETVLGVADKMHAVLNEVGCLSLDSCDEEQGYCCVCVAMAEYDTWEHDGRVLKNR